MELANRQFTPGLWPTLATIILLSVLLSLGNWQLQRAEQKAELFQRYQERSTAKPMHRIDSQKAAEDLYWRKVELSGRFLPEHTFLLDNQVFKGQPGYFIYTPFVLADGRQLIVNRGWVRANPDRRLLPELETPAATILVSGVIKPPPATGWLLADNTDETLPRGLIRLQKIDPLAINERYELRLLPYILRMDVQSAAGFSRDWSEPGSGKEKHLGYAFQWFAMALALLLIFIFVNLEKKSHENFKH